jgi:hypothetical protein
MAASREWSIACTANSGLIGVEHVGKLVQVEFLSTAPSAICGNGHWHVNPVTLRGENHEFGNHTVNHSDSDTDRRLSDLAA